MDQEAANDGSFNAEDWWRWDIEHDNDRSKIFDVGIEDDEYMFC